MSGDARNHGINGHDFDLFQNIQGLTFASPTSTEYFRRMIVSVIIDLNNGLVPIRSQSII